MKITRIIIGVLSLSLLIQLVSLLRQADSDIATHAEAGVTKLHAVWNFYPQTLVEARNLASAIVVGRVAAVAQAPDIVLPAGDRPEEVHREPNQRITIDVLQSMYGNADKQLVLYHYGTDKAFFEDDPPYQVGEEYVFFIMPKKTVPGVYTDVGTYEVISPLGRYRVVNTKLELMPEVRGPLANFVRGKTIAELQQALALLSPPSP